MSIWKVGDQVKYLTPMGAWVEGQIAAAYEDRVKVLWGKGHDGKWQFVVDLTAASAAIDLLPIATPEAEPECECGAESVCGASTAHSTWCPKTP